MRRPRHTGLARDLLLAFPPTTTALGALFLVDALRHQHVLFASLASSAFLIYREPEHQMNGVRVMVTAHLVGVVLGLLSALLLQPGYPAAAVAMIGTILVLVIIGAVHPPAISTTIGFAFFRQQEATVGLFLLSLVLVALLVAVQRLLLHVLGPGWGRLEETA